jgi:peroxiredoxin
MFFATNNEALNVTREKLSATEKMPKFSYYTLDGKRYTNKNLPQDKTTLFVYFNPLCDLCRKETEQILENLDYLKDVQVIMVSPTDVTEIERFVAEYKLKEISQITVLHDIDDTFYTDFGAIGYPNMYIYNAQHEMVAYFDKATGMDELKLALEPVLTKK